VPVCRPGGVKSLQVPSCGSPFAGEWVILKHHGLACSYKALVLDRLFEQKIYVSARGENMRVTPHLYNTDHDVDRFMAALASELQ